MAFHIYYGVVSLVVKETLVRYYKFQNIMSRLSASEMILMVHSTFNSNNISFFLIT